VKTADIVDKYKDEIIVADYIGLKHFGAIKEFSGSIRTIKCFNDNSLIKQVLSTSGNNSVLVVDGKGSNTCALIGDINAALGIKNNWNGIIINGCIRDSIAISKLNFGVLALGTNPQKSAKEFKGQIDINISFAGVSFIPGQYLYVDEDGIVVSKVDFNRNI
jgi:regulator of ribonuclease activity A